MRCTWSYARKALKRILRRSCYVDSLDDCMSCHSEQPPPFVMFGNGCKICIGFAVYMNKTSFSFMSYCQASLVDWQEMSRKCPPPTFFLSKPKTQTAKWVKQNLVDISKAWRSFWPKTTAHIPVLLLLTTLLQRKTHPDPRNRMSFLGIRNRNQSEGDRGGNPAMFVNWHLKMSNILFSIKAPRGGRGEWQGKGKIKRNGYSVM